MELLRRRFADDEAGVSLVEMLVAILILGIVLGAMAQSLTGSLFSVQGQERQVQATGQLQQSMEQVHGVAWENAGLCETVATTYFGGTTYTHQPGTPDEVTEDLVILDDTHATCAGTPLIVPTQTVTRQGVDYTVETVVSWTDDPNDDVSGTDPNSTQDLKHVLVTVTWDHRGEARSVVNETYLAPNALEQPIRTQVEHTSGATYTYLSYDPDPAQSNLLQQDVFLRTFTVVPQSAVNVTWTLHDGTSVSRGMVDVSGDGTEWQLQIPAGSPGYTINRLANGETLFRFTATDAASGDTSVVLDRGLFLIDVIHHEITSSSIPASIRVKDGVACDFTLEVTIRGALTSDLVSATWTNGPTETALTAVSGTSTGSTFSATFTGETAFVAGTTDLTITGVRIADGDAASLVQTLSVDELDTLETC